jgi:hypothetical protein
VIGAVIFAIYFYASVRGGRSAANLITIAYREVGICKSYATLTGNETAKPNEGFAIFKIESVGNEKQSSSFNLDPERFFVDQTKAEMKIKKIYLFRLAALWIRIRGSRRPWA